MARPLPFPLPAPDPVVSDKDAPLPPERILDLCQAILAALPQADHVEAALQLLERARALEFLSRKLHLDAETQNRAAEAVLWTRRRIGEILPPPLPNGTNQHRPERVSTLETLPFSEAARQSGLALSEAHRCVQLAAPSPERFAEHLKDAVHSGELSTAAVLRRIYESRRGSRQSHVETPPLPHGRYSLLYADPPWEYDFGITSGQIIERHYPTLSPAQIAELPIPEIVADDAVLFLWVTSPKLPAGLDVMAAWGFDYKTCMVWVKDRFGMGYYARQQHEILLIGRKGTLPVPDPSNRPPSVITAARGRHSEKPACVYELLERMYPLETKVELFSRAPARPGWSVWGNEVQPSGG